MTYTYKLSRRLARVRVLAGTVAVLFAISCSSDDGTGPTDSDPLGPTVRPTLTTVAGCPAGAYVRLVNVSTVTQLNTALANARPGDQIRLAPGTYNYSSRLEINRSGTAANRITMCGPRTAIIRNHYLNVNASYWHLKGFQVDGNSTAQVAIWVSGGGRNIYDSLEIHHPRRQGIAIQAASFANEIRYNYIHDTGVELATRGECLYIGSVDGYQVDSTWIHHNTLEDCRSEGVELKSGAEKTLVEYNRITNAGHGRVRGSDQPIAVRSDNNRIQDNTITTAPRYLIELYAASGTTANNNIFRRNIGAGAGNGRMFFIESRHSGNVVYCDNIVRSPTILNVSCSR